MKDLVNPRIEKGGEKKKKKEKFRSRKANYSLIFQPSKHLKNKRWGKKNKRVAPDGIRTHDLLFTNSVRDHTRQTPYHWATGACYDY